MKIRINDLTTIISFENDLEEKIIKKSLTWKDNSNCFAGGTFNSKRSFDVCLGKKIKEYFVCFAGFTKEILLTAKQNGIQVTEFEDNRTHFPFQDKQWSHDELMKFFDPKFKYVEHQIRILQAMIKTNTGIIKACTSAGKTSSFIGYMKLTKLPTLILVDKVTLGAQLADEVNKAGIECGFCSGKGYKDGYCMVSTIQSVKKIPNLEKFKCMIVDECHLSQSNSFQEFFKQFGCPLKFGFTASPYNGDYLKFAKIRQFLGSIIVEVKSDELINNEVMAKPTLYFVKNLCEPGFDYASSYDINVVNSERRNKKIINIANMYDRGVAVLVTSIKQGKYLEENIPNSLFIAGETSLEERRQAINDFNEGKIRVLIGSNILNTGISISNMFVLIQGAAQKAITTTIQRIGRVLRITPEKKQCKYYDFIDMGNKFLEKHSKGRLSLFKKEGYNDIVILDEDLNPISK